MEQKNKIIKIFLASSNELEDDREKFGNFIRRINKKIFAKQGIHIDLTEWEDEDSAYRGDRKQNEYNELVRESDIFLALFYTKGGAFTIEEFDVAKDEYATKKSPVIYVFFKDLPEKKKWTPELKAFTQTLGDIGLFWTSYGNQDSLRLHFLYQLLIGENDTLKLKLDGDKVTLGGETVAQMDNLPFAAGNKDYQRICAELAMLPEEIDIARQYLAKHPDDGYARGKLQKKLDHYNDLKKKFAQLQQTLFETSQRIAAMQREQLSDKLRRATEAFEAGDLDGANALLDEIINDPEPDFGRLSEVLAPYHQKIEALLLRAKTVMAEVKTPVKERIEQAQDIYAKADQWAEESALPKEKYEGLLCDYSEFLRYYGLYKEAKPVYLRLISLREHLYGKEHTDTATSFNNIAEVYRKQGVYAKALKYNRKALKIFESVLGPDHPDTALSYNEIGLVYKSQGDYAKALEYYGKALDIRERVLGPDHPDTAESYNNIGTVYDDQGDYAKALEYYRKDLAICERKLGLDHPDTATSYNNIGFVYDEQGDYDKALEYYGKALDIYERVLGPNHPDTATSYNNIGSMYYQQEKYPEALEYLKKALVIRKSKLGEDHPYTKSTQEWIDLTKVAMGEKAS